MTETASAPIDVSTMDAPALNAALMGGQLNGFQRSDVVARLDTLLRAKEQAPAAPAAWDSTKTAPTRAEIPSDSRPVPPTPAESARAEQLERDAYTRPASLVTDYAVPVPAHHKDRETYVDLARALHSGGVPVGVGNMLLNRVGELHQRFEPMTGAELDQRSQVVAQEMQRRWGNDFQSRVTAIKGYLRRVADLGAADNQLKKILTQPPENLGPELFDDPELLEALWRAARWKAAKGP